MSSYGRENGSREQLHHRDLPPIQTSFNDIDSQRSRRPRPLDGAIDSLPESHIPLASNPTAPPPKPQASRGGFFALFSRSKSKRATKPKDDLHASSGTSGTPSLAEGIPALPTPKPEITVQTTTGQTFPLIAVPPPAAAPPGLGIRPSRPTLIPKPQKRSTSPRPSSEWEPPPLFQAYPQALKNSFLKTSVLAAETILRNHNRKQSPAPTRTKSRKSTLRPGHANHAERFSSKHKRHEPGSISTAEWTYKIFMLVTSGYLLQYAGEGAHDRLPERIMQLSKDSVAFASDVIPGKHWVLQVSQGPDESAIMIPDNSKSLLSKLGFQHSTHQKSAGSFLLVLDSAEELNSWMILVRRAIEDLGGTHYHAENEAHMRSSGNSPKTPDTPIRPHTIKRDPSRFSNYNEGAGTDPKPNDALAMRRRSSTRRSTDAPSVATTANSTDQLQLDKLREGSRTSYISTGSRTMTTSCGSSPAPSPRTDKFGANGADSGQQQHRPSFMNPTKSSSNRRRSTQTIPSSRESKRSPAADARVPHRTSRPHSTFGNWDHANARSSSPMPPHSRIPNYSMQYSLANGTSVPPPMRSPGQADGRPAEKSSKHESDHRTSTVGNLPSFFDWSQRDFPPRRHSETPSPTYSEHPSSPRPFTAAASNSRPSSSHIAAKTVPPDNRNEAFAAELPLPSSAHQAAQRASTFRPASALASLPAPSPPNYPHFPFTSPNYTANPVSASTPNVASVPGADADPNTSLSPPSTPVRNRKSMPAMTSMGPPPAPPPNYPLPTLPPPVTPLPSPGFSLSPAPPKPVLSSPQDPRNDTHDHSHDHTHHTHSQDFLDHSIHPSSHSLEPTLGPRGSHHSFYFEPVAFHQTAPADAAASNRGATPTANAPAVDTQAVDTQAVDAAVEFELSAYQDLYGYSGSSQPVVYNPTPPYNDPAANRSAMVAASNRAASAARAADAAVAFEMQMYRDLYGAWEERPDSRRSIVVLPSV
ncbi:MAG: hypothetical protein M1819_005323 [Sarea resinae]|nr:MAG: hypothetical protein M1819_005323 [Sarea resinae]